MPRVEHLPSTRPLYSNLFADIVNIPLQQSYIEIQEKEDFQNTHLNLVARQTESMSKIPDEGERRKTKAHLDITDIKRITESQITKIHNLNQQISLIKGSFSKWCQVKQQREEELVAKNDYISELHSTLENQNTEIIFLKDQIRNSHNTTAINKLSENEEIKKLREQLERKKQTEGSLVELNLSLGQQIQNLKKIIEQVQRENEQGTKYILKCEQNISELYHQNQKKQANLLDCIGRLQQCERKLESLNQKNQNPKEQILQIRVSSLFNENSQLVQLLNEKEQEVGHLNIKISSIAQQIQLISNQKANLLKNIDKYKSIILEQDKQLNTCKTNSYQYQKLLEKNSIQLQTMLTTNNSLQNEIKKLSQKYSLLKYKIAADYKFKEELNEQFRKCKSEFFGFVMKIHRNEENAYQVLKTNQRRQDLEPSFPMLTKYVTDTLYCELSKEISLFQTNMQASLSENEGSQGNKSEQIREIFRRLQGFAEKLYHHQTYSQKYGTHG